MICCLDNGGGQSCLGSHISDPSLSVRTSRFRCHLPPKPLEPPAPADLSSWPGWLAAGWLARSLAHGACARSCAQCFGFSLVLVVFCVFLCIVSRAHFLFLPQCFCFFCSVPLFCWFCVLPHGATRAQRTLQAHATGDGRYRLFEALAPSAGILALQRCKSSPKSETPHSRTPMLCKRLNGCCA